MVLLWIGRFSQKPRNRTGRPFPLQAKGKAGKEQMLPRETCMFVSFLRIGENWSSHCRTWSLCTSSLSIKAFPLPTRGAEGLTLPLFPWSVLPPCHFSDEQGTRFTLSPPFSCMGCCCYFSATLFLSEQLGPKSLTFPEGCRVSRKRHLPTGRKSVKTGIESQGSNYVHQKGWTVTCHQENHESPQFQALGSAVPHCKGSVWRMAL